MKTLALWIAAAAAVSAQEPKKDARYPWLAIDTRAEAHDLAVTINGEKFPLTGKAFAPSPLKEGANVIAIVFKVRPGQDLSKSKGSSLRLGLSPSETPGDGEVLELVDLSVRVAAAECVLKLEMKKASPGTCASVERHWFDVERKRPNEEFEMERDPVEGTVASTVHREWSENGKKKHEIRARKERVTSAEFYAPDGALGATIKDGAGWARQYHDNGKVCQESPYRNGVMEGEEKDYFESGTVQTLTTYADGKMQGPCRRYDESGKLRIEGAHAAGERHGVWIRRDATGKEVARAVFEKGKRVSGDDPFEN